jgi:hypothetical protein
MGDTIRNQEEVRKIIDKINADKDLAQIEDLIKSNVKEFELDGKKYRVRLLTLREKEDLHYLRLQKFGQLLKDENILLEKDLIAIYEKRGIKISELNNSIAKLDAEILGIQKNLGKAIDENNTEAVLKTYKEKFDTLKREKEIIEFQKNDLLQYSLENQLLNYVAEIVTYLSLDIYQDKKWIRLFDDYESFKNCEDSELINKAGMLSMAMQYIG